MHGWQLCAKILAALIIGTSWTVISMAERLLGAPKALVHKEAKVLLLLNARKAESQ